MSKDRSASTCACFEPEASLAGTPPYRRLFLDAMVVEEREGLKRVFHAAKKHPRNPVVPRDKPWEGWGPYVYGTAMRDGDKLRMWYQCITRAPGINVCYAESVDGVHWTKPELGIVDFEGKPTNAVTGGVGIASVIKRDGHYEVFGFGKEGPCRSTSADGLTWTRTHDDLIGSGDVINFFYDPLKCRYVATCKATNRRHRAVGLALSEDGITWRKPVEKAVFGADDLDPDSSQVYGMPVFPYQGCYIGQPWMYRARWLKYGRYSSPKVMYEAQEGSPCTVDTEMAWSWDLISWNRTPERRSFIANGPAGSWDAGQIYTARAPIIVGDQLYFYYGGCDGLHDAPGLSCAIGLATLRLDGFCSLHAGAKEGWLISRREVFNTPRVIINAKTSARGYIVAELVNRNNNVIPGFSRKDCIPFEGDSVRHELAWKTNAFSKDLMDKDRKVRFFLTNADLYSYLPVDINAEIDDSHPDM